MEVIAKNCQLSKTHISKMTYNHINNILACNIDGNDTILFFALNSQSMTFTQLFKGMSKPPGSKISMSWSPDGKYLALGTGYVELWELKDGRLKPVKSYQQDFIEIKIIQWSVDSQLYACGGISRNNTIKIRNVETGKVKQIQLPEGQTISAISFDPYGKYLLLLLRNNTIDIYSVVNYQKYKSLRLSPEGLKINPIKQIRNPSWSPDFGNFVCPSLDDSRINLAINLSRTKDFKTKNIFMGHCTSISCCKFNPKLYRWNGQVTAVVAMGDSAGNVSFWRIGNKNDYPEPLLLSNSMQNSMQVVQDIEWDETGTMLIVNMMKKYVHLIKFVNKQKHFGVQLSNEDVFALIRQIYGSSRATDVNTRQIEVFSLNTQTWIDNQEQNKVNAKPKPQFINQPNQNDKQFTQKNTTQIQKPQEKQQISKMDIQEQPNTSQLIEPHDGRSPSNIPHVQPTPLFVKPTFSQTIISESKSEYVKLSQQKVIIGKNNKKKIQPAMMVRKDEINKISINQQLMNPLQFSSIPGANFSNNMLFSNSMVQTFPSLELPQISFSERQVSLNKHRVLQIKKLNKVTSLQIYDLNQDHELVARRIFPSLVDHIHVSENYIYVINQQFLYIFDLELNPKELPLKVGQVHQFLADDDGTVYFINCEAYLIGFDHVKNVNKTLAPAPLHLLLKQNVQSDQNASTNISIIQFMMTKDCDIFLTIQSQKQDKTKRRQRFMYDVKKNGWVKLEFKQGILESGFSIRITNSEQSMMKNFFTSLCPPLKQRYVRRQNPSLLRPKVNIGNAVMVAEEQEMIFYSKYQKDNQKFYRSLVDYLNSLKSTNKNNELRNTIQKYFFDRESLSYIKDEQERNKVWSTITKQVGGNIIEEFQIKLLDFIQHQ